MRFSPTAPWIVAAGLAAVSPAVLAAAAQQAAQPASAAAASAAASTPTKAQTPAPAPAAPATTTPPPGFAPLSIPPAGTAVDAMGAANTAAAAAAALTAQAANAPPPTAGRDLAATCTGCHAAAAPSGALPALAGWPAERITAAMAAYARGERPSTVMQQIAKGYTDEDVKRLAQWFATQPAR